MEKDCRYIEENDFFTCRAAAIIIEDGCVLMIKNDAEDYYYSVGGAIHLHETAEDAVRRETYEETGVHYEIERLAFMHENFFNGLIFNKPDMRCHEIAFYFLMKPKGIKTFKCESYGFMNAKEEAVWIPIKHIDNYKLYPAFFKEKLLNMKEQIEHIVTHR